MEKIKTNAKNVVRTLVLVMCFLLPTHHTLAQTQETIVDRLNKTLGVMLPTEYNSKLLDFVRNDTIMRTRSATAYTEEFIANEMKKDWGINKQNQYLFIWSKIYRGISQKILYNFLDDEKEARRDEYRHAIKLINTSYEAYKTGFKTYMEKGIAEADRRSAEYKRQSAEADRRSAEAIQTTILVDYYGLAELIKYYLLPHNEWDPEEEVKAVKKAGKEIAQNLEKHNIDYRSLLPVEVQQYIGLHQAGNQRTNLTCEQAIRNLYTICLQELNKAYQLYQKAPQVDRTEEKQRAKEIVEYCKKYNVNHKAILTPEARQFYGVE